MVILLRNQMAAEDVFSFQEFLPEDERKHRPPAMSGRRIFYIRQTCERRNGYVSFYRSDENRRRHEDHHGNRGVSTVRSAALSL